jgi:hypothetical protein
MQELAVAFLISPAYVAAAAAAVAAAAAAAGLCCPEFAKELLKTVPLDQVDATHEEYLNK